MGRRSAGRGFRYGRSIRELREFRSEPNIRGRYDTGIPSRRKGRRPRAELQKHLEPEQLEQAADAAELEPRQSSGSSGAAAAGGDVEAQVVGAPVSGENQVDIDAVALAAEAAAVELGPDPAASAEEIAPTAEQEYSDIEARARRDWLGGMQFAVNGFASIATGWKLLPEECEILALDLAMASAAWFPDGALPVRYMVLLNLGGHALAIASARRDPETGRFRPLRALAAAPGTAPTAQAVSQVEAVPGGVTTSA